MNCRNVLTSTSNWIIIFACIIVKQNLKKKNDKFKQKMWYEVYLVKKKIRIKLIYVCMYNVTNEWRMKVIK